jgi:hypothetical protein
VVPDSPAARRILWILAATCLVAALVAIPLVGGDDGDGPTDLAADDGTTTTLAVVGAAGDGGDAGSGAAASTPAGGAAPTAAPGAGAPAPAKAATGGNGTAAGAAGSSEPGSAAAAPATTAAPPEDLGPAQDPGPAKPPRAGVYRFKSTAAGETRDTTTTIEDKGTTGSETRQIVKARGSGFDIDSDVAWRPDGVHVLSSVIMFGTNKGSCDWEPDTLQLRLPITKGASWESTSTCQMTGMGATPIPVTRKITGKFLELRRVRIAGQAVDVWAIEGTEHLEAAGSVTDSSGITLFSPKHGFAVSNTAHVKGSSPQGAREFDMSTEAQNLDPE